MIPPPLSLTRGFFPASHKQEEATEPVLARAISKYSVVVIVAVVVVVVAVVVVVMEVVPLPLSDL